MLRLIAIYTIYFVFLYALIWAIGAVATLLPSLGFLPILIGVGSIVLVVLVRPLC